MVVLSFKVIAPAPIEKVWEYFGKLQNIPLWDPSTVSVVPIDDSSK